MTSPAASAAVPAATSGSYQPAGGAARRTRRTAAKAPWRVRSRPLVRRLGGWPLVFPACRASGHGLGPDEAQVARPQLPPQRQHAAWPRGARWPPLRRWRGRLIRPIHPAEFLAAHARQPRLPVAEAHAKAARHGALRLPTPNRRHHGWPIFFRESCIPQPDQTDLDQMALAR